MNLVMIAVFAILMLAFGTYLYMGNSGPSALEQPLTATAFRGTFIKEVLDQGEIQSSENVEIRCQIKSRYGSKGATVKTLVEEGKLVKAGDVLITLNSDEIEAALEEQTIARNNAFDALTAAENDLESVKATKEEYVEGLYKEEKSLKENAISQAKEELDKAIEYLEFSRKLQAKGFITTTILRNDEAAVDRAKRTWESANQSLLVLEKFTYTKFTSDFDSKINSAKSKRDAAEANLKIEEKQLAEIEEQLDSCKILVPEGQSGQVVYANIFSRRGNAEFVLEEGAAVREGQVLIKLPNPDKMQVRATVNESRVTSIKEGMQVRIAVDALNGAELDGTVTKVNQYAEPEGWGGGGVRKYGVYIEILNPIRELRPGMNASVTIETERQSDALMIPIQAVYGYRGKTFCLVNDNGVWVTTEVEVGSYNDTNMVITKGLEPGSIVGLNPAGFQDMLQLPDLPEIVDDEKRQEPDQQPSMNQKSKKAKSKKPESKKPDSKKPESPDAKRTGKTDSKSEQTKRGQPGNDDGKKSGSEKSSAVSKDTDSKRDVKTGKKPGQTTNLQPAA